MLCESLCEKYSNVAPNMMFFLFKEICEGLLSKAQRKKSL